jgi:hypothetical protein
MKKYIDKSALVAEIEKRYNEYISSILKHYDACKEAKAQELGKILTILDTLEVKEVEEEPSDDLEEEIDKELYENWYGEYINLDQFRESAKHFFELGLKAQKGE